MHLASAPIEQASIIWVLVANGQHAQIYRYHQHKKLMPMHDSKRESHEQEMKRHELTPVPDMGFQAESLKDFQVGHDGRGSKIGGARPGYNSCEPHLDIRDEVKQNLVGEIADKLKKAHETKAFDHLVIAASPQTLGALRSHLGKSVRDCVVAEIGKDFTNDKNHALLTHLQETFEEARTG